MYPRHGLNPARGLREFAYLSHDCGVWAAVNFENIRSTLGKLPDTGHFVLWPRLEERGLPHDPHDLLPRALILRDALNRVKRAGEHDFEPIIHHFDTLLVQSAERWCEFAGDLFNPHLVMETRVL
jgi:hypothetical protein